MLFFPILTLYYFFFQSVLISAEGTPTTEM